EFFDLAQRFDVDFNELRELWLLDPRIGKSHTFVFPDQRGFGGRCLPKDLAAIINSAERLGYEASLLKAVLTTNERMRTIPRRNDAQTSRLTSSAAPAPLHVGTSARDDPR